MLSLELVSPFLLRAERTGGNAGGAPDVAASGHTAGGDVGGDITLGIPQQTWV